MLILRHIRVDKIASGASEHVTEFAARRIGIGGGIHDGGRDLIGARRTASQHKGDQCRPRKRKYAPHPADPAPRHPIQTVKSRHGLLARNMQTRAPRHLDQLPRQHVECTQGVVLFY